MAAIKGLPKDMTTEALRAEVARGGAFVCFQVCVSIIILTQKSPSAIYFIRPGRSSRFHYANVFCMIATLFLGWWGIPWGPIYTVQALATNFADGEDVTWQVMGSIGARRGA